MLEGVQEHLSDVVPPINDSVGRYWDGLVGEIYSFLDRHTVYHGVHDPKDRLLGFLGVRPTRGVERCEPSAPDRRGDADGSHPMELRQLLAASDVPELSLWPVAEDGAYGDTHRGSC